MKKLILVTSPPACGKTFISKKLAKALTNCVYLDKDTLIVLSKQIFKVAGEEYNRSSDFFQREIRDYEYYAVLDLAFELTHYSGDDKVAAVQTLLDTRAAARKEKNWTLADAVRNGLSELGFTVEDTPQGARVSYGE